MLALLSIGCPWVPPAEHARNHRALEALLDADADADADTDTDTDTDADTDTDPGPCVDDAYEPNDTLLTPATIPIPSALDLDLCAANVSPVYGWPVDLFRVDVGPLDVLDVSIAASDVPCDALSFGLSVTDEAGVTYPGASAQGGCPQLAVGWGADTYLVWVTGALATGDQPYQLVVDRHECRDSDGDGFLAGTCGGPDCSDLEEDRYPGATDVPLDGTDQDCDGGDDLEAGQCPVVLASALVATGTLPCADLTAGAAWDHWQVPAPVQAGEGVSVVVQNSATGAADLLAYVVDGDGTTHYGLDPTRSELDDEESCQVAAWTGQTKACPAECLTNDGWTGGTVDVWVAQHPGEGCAADASYTLIVYSDATAVSPALIGDDVALP